MFIFMRINADDDNEVGKLFCAVSICRRERRLPVKSAREILGGRAAGGIDVLRSESLHRQVTSHFIKLTLPHITSKQDPHAGSSRVVFNFATRTEKRGAFVEPLSLRDASEIFT